MKVVIKFEVSDDYRRSIRHRVGDSGKATRRDLRRHVMMLVDADAEDSCFEYRRYIEHRFRRSGRKISRLGASLGMKPAI